LTVSVILSSKPDYFEYPNDFPVKEDFRSTLLSLEDFLPNEPDKITKNFIRGVFDTIELDTRVS
jgi:hypothetical protein